MIEAYLCLGCGVMKPLDQMRKRLAPRRITQCKKCEMSTTKVKTDEPEKVSLKVSSEKSLYTPYVPEKHNYRNNGNVHIKSVGFKC